MAHGLEELAGRGPRFVGARFVSRQSLPHPVAFLFMAEIETSSPEANYLTRNNIVHPLSNLPGSQGDANIAADEARGRADILARKSYASGVPVTGLAGGSIKKGK